MVSSLQFFFYCSGDHRDLHSFPTRRSSDLHPLEATACGDRPEDHPCHREEDQVREAVEEHVLVARERAELLDRKSTRLNSSHSQISYAVFCLKKKKKKYEPTSRFNLTRSCS